MAGSIVGGQRVDDLRNLGDVRDRDAAQFGVPLDLVFALGKVDAERFLTRHLGMLPLDARADRGYRLIRGSGGAAEFSQRECADAGNISFDNIAFHLCLLRVC